MTEPALRGSMEVAMPWWGWVIVLVVAIAVLFGAFLAVQMRRRRGGVIIDPSGPGGSGGAGKPGDRS